ncbi:MAG: hypothetical protein CVV34_00145 [Methanomicrobiales archaeon HGW-Methanomicrobiales-5]|nr:MAG: hypothetical protein CVV34_00145 [Methanomicrobiales archaeon HGW-Methanomicrobiales-5]
MNFSFISDYRDTVDLIELLDPIKDFLSPNLSFRSCIGVGVLSRLTDASSALYRAVHARCLYLHGSGSIRIYAAIIYISHAKDVERLSQGPLICNPANMLRSGL